YHRISAPTESGPPGQTIMPALVTDLVDVDRVPAKSRAAAGAQTGVERRRAREVAREQAGNEAAVRESLRLDLIGQGADITVAHLLVVEKQAVAVDHMKLQAKVEDRREVQRAADDGAAVLVELRLVQTRLIRRTDSDSVA